MLRHSFEGVANSPRISKVVPPPARARRSHAPVGRLGLGGPTEARTRRTSHDQREAVRADAFPGIPYPYFEKILRNRPQRSTARGVGTAYQTLDDEERPGRWSKRQTGRRSQWALLLARAWASAPSARGFACGTFTVPQPPASAVVPPYAATEPQIPRQNAPSTRPVANPTGSSVSPSA
jgi:hypothetical protein